MTASIVIVIAQGLKDICEHMTKKNFTTDVKNDLEKLLSGMQHRDRWELIEHTRTLVRCTFLNPRFKAIA